MADESEYPWRDEDRLYKLYREENYTMKQIAECFGCSASTVRRWIHRFNLQKPESATYHTNMKGYEHWMSWNGERNDHCKVHRLAAVAWYGFDEVSDKVVHHITNIPWDNREESLEIVGHAEHSRKHRLEETEEQSKRRVRGVQ